MGNIPPRRPVGDDFSGVLLRCASAVLLAPEALANTEVVAAGDFTVRYAVRYLEKPHLALVPGLLAIDYGEFFNGEAMWDFIFAHSNRYPRADVLGYRTDGTDEMIPLKKLDLDQPLQVVVYDTPEAAMPLSIVHALITPADQAYAPRLQKHLPRYATLDEWLNRERA